MQFNKSVGTRFIASESDLSPMVSLSRNELCRGRDTSGPYNRRIHTNLLNSIIAFSSRAIHHGQRPRVFQLILAALQAVDYQ